MNKTYPLDRSIKFKREKQLGKEDQVKLDAVVGIPWRNVLNYWKSFDKNSEIFAWNVAAVLRRWMWIGFFFSRKIQFLAGIEVQREQ